ncbi:N-acetyl-gamma-glutamyl-phosphate reductase [bacterium]|nr:N-acetyl-gamma-glutamyl-phosphate reductase [Chloroflexi bacterium CFX6]RIL12402.1 MAG: N-acetyl-gamma-glutamyl-phosphate reductase [bacterium]
MTIRAGVFGATGYTGLELIALLAAHPDVALRFAASESRAGRSLRDVHAGAPDVPLIRPHDAPVGDIDVAFLCLPHAASATTAAWLLDRGPRVIDLSADFRLRDPAAYRQWYGADHPAPGLLGTAVYGLTEVARPLLPGARLVANPGCYATSILLPLHPLAGVGATRGTVIADSKSGVSGAGRVPKLHTHFVEVAENFAPYSIGRTHRHIAEIDQALAAWSAAPPLVVFSPHLLPVTRGILTTLYVPLAPDWDHARVHARLAQAFAGEPFVRVLPAGEAATLAHVLRTNRCVVGVHPAGRDGLAIVTSALDNLVKGAAGQALQNMNAMFGLPETRGLTA